MEEQWLVDLRNFVCDEPDPNEFIDYVPHFNKGIPKSEQHRLNISKSKIGEKNNFYGKKHTEETRNKMSESQSKVNRSGKNNPMTKHTPEAREKMRLAWERRRAIIREKATNPDEFDFDNGIRLS
jgi:hypothetical protein